MSFRLKTIIGIASIQLVVLFVLLLNGLNTLRSSNEDELLKRAYSNAALVATTTQKAVLASDLAALEATLDQVITNPDVVYARVVGTRVTLAQRGARDALARPFKADQTLSDVDDGVFDVYAEINVAEQTFGRVELGISVGAIQEVLGNARNQLVLFGVLTMGGVMLFSYFLALYLTRGLETLKRASEAIASGELGHQIPVKGQDELASTAQAYNEMSLRLRALDEERRAAEERVMQLNAELEQRVELRTSQLATLNKKLEYQALHDALTQLPNRTLYYDRLHQQVLIARRNRSSFTLMTMDLNRFKQVNDLLGHHNGDLVLQEAAARLRGVLRQSDTVARMGGDEFTLLLPTATAIDEAVIVARKILQSLSEPMLIEGQSLEIGASIGVALFPQHGTDAHALMRHSDSAMYVSKRTHSGFTVYDATLDAEDAERLTLHMELRQALSHKQFVLHFQPKVEFASNCISGVEALVRWQHPHLGLIYPDVFLPIAEKNMMMREMTLLVLDLAMHQSELWQAQGLDLAIAINISATNLQDSAFPDDVAAALARRKVNPKKFELEVTETAIMSDPLRAIENITRLNHMGLQIAIDDFGTGYSSMAYLRKLLVSKIKIDKSFVIDMHRNHEDEVIVRSTVDLGHNLGLKVVAEGVETQAAWDKLKHLGCDSAQGYFMGKPVPAEELEKWLMTSRWAQEQAPAAPTGPVLVVNNQS